MVKRSLYIVLFLFLVSSFVEAQIKEEISDNKKKLSEISKQIDMLEKKLKQRENDEQANLETLDNLKHQELLFNKLIKRFSKEENSLGNQISSLQNQIDTLSKEIKLLKEKYSAYAVWIYKNRNKDKYEYLFSEEPVTKSLDKVKYFEKISELSRKKLDYLNEKQKQLKELKIKLENKKNLKQELASQKSKELEKVLAKQKRINSLISKLRTNKANIEEEISKKRLAEIEINNLIEQLEEEERRRIAALKSSEINENINISSTVFNYNKLADFASLKGKMSWPVEGKISRTFGEIENKKLKTKTWNYGIDIKTKENNEVKAVCEGVVSIVKWVAGFGSVLILTHKDKYRTVYAHMYDIRVDIGQKVNKGDILGRVNNSLEGNILHFEIWNERNFKNPLKWLVKK